MSTTSSSAGVAVYAAMRRRVRHAATCRPPGLNRTVTQKKRAHLLSLVVAVAAAVAAVAAVAPVAVVAIVSETVKVRIVYDHK